MSVVSEDDLLSNEVKAVGENRLCIVTLNTWKCEGNYRMRIHAMKSAFADLQPDIVACQEVFQAFDQSADTYRELAETLHMPGVFLPARRKIRRFEKREVLSDSGLALFSHLPLVDVDKIRLPSELSDGERWAVMAVYERHGWTFDGKREKEEVLVVNTHLASLPGRTYLRRQQLGEILAHPWLREKGRLCLICGDLNTKLEDLDELINDWGSLKLYDCYALGNGRKPRGTWNGGTKRIAEQEDETCLDYILLVIKEAELLPRVDEASIVFNQPDPLYGFYPSDHFGVMATFLNF